MSNRTLKQSICVSEDINRLSWFEEVLFYRLIVNCDDYGRFDGRASVIRSQLFPLKDSLTAKAVEQALHELANVGLVEIYQSESGRPTLRLPSWGTHQRILTRTLRGDSPQGEADCDSYTGEKNILPEDSEKKTLSSGSNCRAQKTGKSHSESGIYADDAEDEKTNADSGANMVNQENESEISEEKINIAENKDSEIKALKINIKDSSKKECVEKKFFAGGTSEQKPPAAVTHTEKNKKKRYGQYENVLLTDSEYAKILAMRGGAKAIEFLSEYIEMKGYKANSHYLCIASKNGWVFKAMKERGIPLEDEPAKCSFDLDEFFKLAVERGKKEGKQQ